MKSMQLIIYLRSLAILSIVGLLVGCGGGGGGSTPTQPAGDTTRPTIDSSSLSPDNHAIGVDPNTVISVTFSEDIDPTSITGATFTVAGGGSAASGTISTIDDTTTFTPDAPLLRGITYTATIKAGVEDLAGNALATDYSWTFTILTNPAKIAAGFSHTVAILDDGTLWSWGLNDDGQLGVGDTVARNSPTPEVNNDTDWVSVAAGYNFTLALKADGTLWAWGDNTNGQLGTNTVLSSDTPLPVGAAENWVAIACGMDHCLALNSSGELYAWGDNTAGQLGIGAIAETFTPTKVDGYWVTVAAGGFHSLAINNDGELYTWGFNAYGQLGDGLGGDGSTDHDRIIPYKLGDDTDWASAAGGTNHSLAIKSDGSLWAWGLNENGQLGVDDILIKTTPQPEANGDIDWVSVAGGDLHTLALKNDTTIWAWGDNNYGQLGQVFANPTIPNEITP